MSSRTPRSRGRIETRAPEPEDSYPHIREPKQSHTGSLLAFVSVLAVLGFGFWTAVATLTGASDNPLTKTSPTPVPTRETAATPVPTTAPAPAVATPEATPAQTAAPAPGGSRVHEVGQGDTLTKIAQRYGTTVDAIMKANGITDRNKVLHVGEKLTIP